MKDVFLCYFEQSCQWHVIMASGNCNFSLKLSTDKIEYVPFNVSKKSKIINHNCIWNLHPPIISLVSTAMPALALNYEWNITYLLNCLQSYEAQFLHQKESFFPSESNIFFYFSMSLCKLYNYLLALKKSIMSLSQIRFNVIYFGRLLISLVFLSGDPPPHTRGCVCSTDDVCTS